ncbi:MAG: Asp-tRNA(Asn)/Glu-tRNA(Gln) amidotransferase GatCAB subunit B, partial [Firmicutes bacterium]|nr:Asp-tRNA(Asn)/Glu-tRNA(Gln) amidotransferase GatCAB subunit B [Bacillota bacterium]
ETKLGVRTEMKNINSTRSMARAVAFETARHIEAIEDGTPLVQETRRWDDDTGESYAMREKENAADYNYFPSPDLPPVILSEEEIERARQALPELPEAKKRRYMEELGLPEYDTNILTGSVHLVRLFERAAAMCGDPKEAANWVLGEVLRLLQQTGTLPEDMAFDFDSLGKVIVLVQKNVINRGTAKKVFAEVFTNDTDPEAYVKAHNLALVTDDSAIRATIEQVLAANEKSVSEYRGGKAQAMQYLIGQSMKALRGQAPAREVTAILKELLG